MNEPAGRSLSQQSHRRLIGYLGLFLPALLYVIAGIRHTDRLADWVLLDSISAYYYTGAVAVFVGVLFALSLFLFTYPGYDGVSADRVVGRISGAAALGVTLFPTTAPMCVATLSWWSDWMRTTHYVSAVVLFVCFILFATWLFRKSNVPLRQDRPAAKRRRDDICLACGIVMIGAVIWIASTRFTKADIFWPESIAVVAFAVSWLVKGAAEEPILRAVRGMSSKSANT